MQKLAYLVCLTQHFSALDLLDLTPRSKIDQDVARDKMFTKLGIIPGTPVQGSSAIPQASASPLC